ncbi:MAG: Trp family transcriptional regulator [Patescibacteria group bacterium]
MRLSTRRVNPHLKKQLFSTLHQAIADLRTPGEVETVLSAFLSSAEHEILAKRVAVSYWLDKGRGYNNIRDNLKVSSATIASIQNAYNSNKGVKLILTKIRAEEWANVWAEKIKKLVR